MESNDTALTKKWQPPYKNTKRKLMNTKSQKPSGELFVISAPSGAGKTTVSQSVLRSCSEKLNLTKVVTYTSRQPRLGELNEVDYHFISSEEFKRRQQDGFFLETTDYAGNFYGSPASILNGLKEGKSYLMVTDRPGALVIKELVPAAVLIWLQVQDLQILRQRLESRGTDASQVIEKRLSLAEKEMSLEDEEQAFNYHVQNNIFDITVEQVKNIIEQELSNSCSIEKSNY